MELHIGNEIRRVLEEKGKKALWLAKQLNTSDRNLYDLLNREEISTGQLVKISKALDFDFFSLYQTKSLEPENEYEVRRASKVAVVVELDGLETTLQNWIAKLTAINQII